MSRQNDLLAWLSRDLGVSKKELREMCLREGLEKLNREKRQPAPQAENSTLPIFLPADDVRLLQDICQAAKIEGGAESFVDAIIGDMVRDTLDSTANCQRGVVEFIFDAWVFTPEEEAQALTAVHEVVHAYSAK